MKSIILMAGAAAALAACGSKDEAGGNASAVAATNAAAPSNTATANASTPSASAGAPAQGGGLSLEPGLYEVKATIGAGGANGTHKATNCLTREEVAKANAGLFTDKENKSCTQDGFTVANGRIQGTMTCSGGDIPGKATVTMSGTYSSTAYDMDQKMAIDAGGMKMNVETHISGRRVGECPAGQQ